MANLSIKRGSTGGMDVNINETQVSVESTSEVVVEIAPTPRIELTVDRGVSGPAGPNAIGGYGFNISNLQADDVLAFGGTAWINRPQTQITDGGNF